MGNINNIFLGVLFYTLGQSVLLFFLPRTYCAIICLIGLIIFFAGIIRVNKRISLDKELIVLYVFFLIVSFITVFRGFFSLQKLSSFITLPTIFTCYLAPLLCLISLKLTYFKSLYKYGCILSLIGLAFCILERDIFFINAETYFYELIVSSDENKYFYIRSAIIPFECTVIISFFMVYGNIPIKKKIFFFIVYIISIFPLLASGRRGELFLALFFLLYYFVKRMNLKNIFYLLILFLSLFCIIQNFAFDFLMEHFPILSNRLFDDTRSFAEQEFYDAMTLRDWIFGRGSSGVYYSETFGIRNVIETGYLNIILKGGLLMLIPYLLILLLTFVKGFFFSRNTLTKIMSLYILHYILSLYPLATMDFDFRFVLLWICIACCGNKSFRKDVEIDSHLYNILFSKKVNKQ